MEKIRSHQVIKTFNGQSPMTQHYFCVSDLKSTDNSSHSRKADTNQETEFIIWLEKLWSKLKNSSGFLTEEATIPISFFFFLNEVNTEKACTSRIPTTRPKVSGMNYHLANSGNPALFKKTSSSIVSWKN